MRKILLLNVIAGLVAALCLSFTSSRPQQAGMAASIKRGEVVFQANCLSCHQANAAGVPNLYPTLIKTKYVLGEKNALITIVLNGLTGEIEVGTETFNSMMPQQNFLTDQQVADVLTYIRNSFTNKASQIKPAEVKKIRAKLKL